MLSEPERNPCPDYYLTSDNREFFDFFYEAVGTWLQPVCENWTRGADIYHCLFSSAEHRFRRGLKAGELESDRVAMIWWENQGRAVYMKYDHGRPLFKPFMDFDTAAKSMAFIVDHQRSLKLAATLVNTN